MKLSGDDLQALLNVARKAALLAGRIVAEAASLPHHRQCKANQETPAARILTDTDLRSQSVILAQLRPTLECYELALLTEECPDNAERLSKDYHWSVDPLDGTLYFAEGLSGHAVSIALVSREGVPWIGVVYEPSSGVLYHALRGSGAYRNDQPWHVRARSATRLTLLADRSYTESPCYTESLAHWNQIAQSLHLQGVEAGLCGGAVCNALQVISRAPAVYYKSVRDSGGGSLWDYAATACIVTEAGGVATDLNGEPLDLNRSGSTFANHRGVLFASHPLWAGNIRRYLKKDEFCVGP